MKPILFNTEMVRAISEGRKTVTRRVLKEPFEIHPNGLITKPRGNERLCPYEPPYQVNDVLYVRETWRWLPCWQCGNDLEGGMCNKENRYNVKYGECGCYQYKADGGALAGASKPSIHMPKEAARIFLRVTGVRVERLTAMTKEDFIKEGITAHCDSLECSLCMDECSLEERFKELWNSTLGRKGTPEYYGNCWAGNPFVWVIEFERITKEQAYELDRR